MALHSPLNLEQIFIVDLAGTPEIFSFIALALIGFVMGKLKFNNTESLVLFALFAVIMAAYLPAIYVIVNLIVGIIIYYQLSKMAK